MARSCSSTTCCRRRAPSRSAVWPLWPIWTVWSVVAGVAAVPISARPIVSAGGLEGEEPGLACLFDVDVSQLTADQLRVRMEDAQRAFKRQNARLAHLRTARQRAQQVMEAESHLRSSAERSIEVLEAELNRFEHATLSSPISFTPAKCSCTASTRR
jgi:hypothetical protein